MVDAATLAPVAGQRIGWRSGTDVAAPSDRPWVFQRPTTTDAAGKFRVRMPPGPARAVPLEERSGARSGTLSPAMIEWTDGGGTIVLKLTR